MSEVKILAMNPQEELERVTEKAWNCQMTIADAIRQTAIEDLEAGTAELGVQHKKVRNKA